MALRLPAFPKLVCPLCIACVTLVSCLRQWRTSPAFAWILRIPFAQLRAMWLHPTTLHVSLCWCWSAYGDSTWHLRSFTCTLFLWPGDCEFLSRRQVFTAILPRCPTGISALGPGCEGIRMHVDRANFDDAWTLAPHFCATQIQKSIYWPLASLSHSLPELRIS